MKPSIPGRIVLANILLSTLITAYTTKQTPKTMEHNIGQKSPLELTLHDVDTGKSCILDYIEEQNVGGKWITDHYRPGQDCVDEGVVREGFVYFVPQGGEANFEITADRGRVRVTYNSQLNKTEDKTEADNGFTCRPDNGMDPCGVAFVSYVDFLPRYVWIGTSGPLENK